MSNIESILIQSLGYTTSTSSISSLLKSLGYTSSTSTSSFSDLLNAVGLKTTTTGTTSKTKANIQFAAIMAQLNRTLDSDDTTTAYTPKYVNTSTLSTYQSSVKPSIAAIIQKIKENNNESKSIDDQVSQYLLDNYGGTKANVILSLSGASSLPLQATAMQDYIFQTIVSRLSSQIRTRVYSGQDTLTNTDFDSTDTDIDVSCSSVSETEPDNIDM